MADEVRRTRKISASNADSIITQNTTPPLKHAEEMNNLPAASECEQATSIQSSSSERSALKDDTDSHDDEINEKNASDKEDHDEEAGEDSSREESDGEGGDEESDKDLSDKDAEVRVYDSGGRYYCPAEVESGLVGNMRLEFARQSLSQCGQTT